MFTVGGLGAGQAEAQLKVDITSGRVEPMPVAAGGSRSSSSIHSVGASPGMSA